MTKPMHYKAKKWVNRDQPIIINGVPIIVDVKHPLYRLRYTLLTRCYNPKPSDYKYYKAKNIQVCDEWKNVPESFFSWCLKNGWSKGLSLDRIDPNKDYEPENCQFITGKDNLKKMHVDNDMTGENAPRAMLTLNKVIEIRKLLELGVTCKRIADDFKVSKSTISAIKRRQNWKV